MASKLLFKYKFTVKKHSTGSQRISQEYEKVFACGKKRCRNQMSYPLSTKLSPQKSHPLINLFL